MAAGSCLPALIAAVYGVLSADATLSGLVTGVFNNVPEGTAFPYVHVTNPTEIPLNAMGRFGKECTIQIVAVSDSESDLAALNIANRCVVLLDYKSLTVSGYTFAFAAFDTLSSYQEVVDGKIVRHMVGMFRFKVMS